MNQLKGDDESSRAPSIDAEGGAGPILPDRAFGLTALSNAAVSTTASGLLAYTAGCLAVLYDPELNTQTRLFKTEFAISSIATTIDGRFIALGCRNSDAFIKIFDIHSGNEVVTLKGHNYGVGCMAFSQDGKVLVSCGYKLDKQLYLWNWSKRQGVSAKIGNKVNSVCFHPQGGYFVTCGDRHLKWWFFSRSESSGEVSELKGHPASILEAQRYSHFTDCCFGMGAARHTLYCCTATGLLCTFLENRIMDKALQLNCSSANSVSVFASQLLIGCSDGACFVYNISDLSLIGTFPYPDALPMSAVQYAAAQPPSPSSLSFAACYAVRSIPNSRLVAIVYADRSMIIWDVVDFNKIAKHRFFPNHRACIWDIHFLLNGAGGGEGGLEGFGGSSDEVNTSPFPSSTFVTCSADSSIRFWTLDPKGSRQSAWRIPFSKDALRIIDTGADDAEFALEQHVYFDVRRDSPDLEHPHRVQVYF
jgi:WD40 repeat protein